MGDKSKILIVEDEVIVAKDIQMSLENLGYEVLRSRSFRSGCHKPV